MGYTKGLWYFDAVRGHVFSRPDPLTKYVIADLESSNDANGHLIAADPDMLGALNLALEYWAHRQQRYKNRHPAWVREARAALAKAKGIKND